MSPLQQMFASIVAQDETERAIDFAQLSANAEHASDYRAAQTWAQLCLDSCDGWDLETLSCNIGSSFGDCLSMKEIEDIADGALKAATEGM